MNGTNPMGENGKVTYSVKELLAEIRGDVKEVLIRVENKADKSDLIQLAVKVDKNFADLDSRVSDLENDETANNAVIAYKKWFWPLVVGFVSSTFLAIAGIVVQLIRLISIGGKG